MIKEKDIISRFMREFILQIDLEGRIDYLSPNASKILKMKDANILGDKLSEYVPQFSLEAVEQTISLSLNKIEGTFVVTHMKEYDDNRTKSYSVLDLTKFESEMNRVNRIKNIFEKTDDIVYSFNIEEMKFDYLNSAVYKNLGYTAEEHEKEPLIPFCISHPEDFPTQLKMIQGKIDYSKGVSTRFRNKEGEYIWFENFSTPTYDKDGKLKSLEGITRNIHSRKLREDEFEYRSYIDVLSGLYNRTYFEKELVRLDSLGLSVGVIVCDLDNMKKINDTFGHMEGDKAIVKTAEMLKKVFIKNSVICRIGGDEFVLLINSVEENEIQECIQSFRKEIENENHSGNDYNIHVSVGYSYSKSSKGKMIDLMDKADSKMYEEKKSRKKYRV